MFLFIMTFHSFLERASKRIIARICRYLPPPTSLDDYVERWRIRLGKCLLGHSRRPKYASRLAVALMRRFRKQGILSDLDEAIELYRILLDLCPPGHTYRTAFLHELGSNLLVRFRMRGILSDRDEAIELFRVVLALPPNPGWHYYRPSCLHNLADSLIFRFQQRKVFSDLDESIELYRAVLVLCPSDHRHPHHHLWHPSLHNLSGYLLDRFRHRGVLSDMEEAFELYSQLARASPVATQNSLGTAKSWAASAEHFQHHSALVAYQIALKLLDEHVTVLSSSLHRFDMVKGATSSLAMDAFSCCVRRGALTTAVELVEQARAIFWTQLARSHTPLEALSASSNAGAFLAAEFKRVSLRLRNTLDTSPEELSEDDSRLPLQWDGVISRIRMLPNFSRFLLPPLFSDLQKAAEGGPVIIVNASQYSCDALIILVAHNPIHIPLHVTKAEVSELSSELRFLTERAGFHWGDRAMCPLE